MNFKIAYTALFSIVLYGCSTMPAHKTKYNGESTASEELIQYATEEIATEKNFNCKVIDSIYMKIFEPIYSVDNVLYGQDIWVISGCNKMFTGLITFTASENGDVHVDITDALPDTKEVNSVPFKKGLLYFNCDSFPGNASESEYFSSHSISLVKGEMRLNGQRRHKDWLPTMSIGILSDDEKEKFFLNFSSLNKDAKLTPSISFIKEGELERRDLKGSYSAGDIIEFTISKINETEAKIFFSGQENEYIVPFRKDAYKISSSCSTSWAEINIKGIDAPSSKRENLINQGSGTP